jgi:MYXO-CTERM domain-containing protein
MGWGSHALTLEVVSDRIPDDANADGMVTDADCTIGADHYGEGATSAPESASVVLVLAGALTLLRRRS